ncbi:hypothetical protein L2E82_10433 [Cichorium intybus]|uniref:Uncharacterized protein n=1 Tax=Cichorium intybus TaxID=13427 RepID=A0ACB9GAP1_CICIN|nr:hypothetical protein L2E82_10433 [Cichorium intybus]
MFLSYRKNEPAHYLLKIESFSILSEAGTIKFESEVFETGGHKWSDDDGNRTTFHENQMKWGFDKLISLQHFSESSRGYLFNDSCVFGVEISAVPKYAQKDRCLSMIKPPPTMNTYSWTVDKFAALTDYDMLTSEVFKVGKVKWNLLLCPEGAGTNIIIVLQVHEAALLPPGWRVYANYELRVKNQSGYADQVREFNNWFCQSNDNQGSSFRDISNGFLLNDKMIVEAKILVIGMLRNFI